MQITHVVKGKQKPGTDKTEAVKMIFSPLHVGSHSVRVAPDQLPLALADRGGEPMIISDFSPSQRAENIQILRDKGSQQIWFIAFK